MALGFKLELDESYAKVLEKRINERFPNVNIPLVSAGIAGYNNYHQIVEFERLQPIIGPDLIVTTFVADNDVYENWVFEDQLEDCLQSGVGFLGRHGHHVRPHLRDTFPARFFASNRKKSHNFPTHDLLSQLAYRIEQRDLPFLILTIPARHQIRPDVYKGLMLLTIIGAGGYLFRHNRLIVDGLPRRRMPYLDIFPVLKSHDNESWVYDEIIWQAVFEDIGPEISICLSKRGLLVEKSSVVK